MEQLEALQVEIYTSVMGDDGRARGGSPLWPIISMGTDELRGVVEIEALVADDRARAFAREQWGDAVELSGMLQPVD